MDQNTTHNLDTQQVEIIGRNFLVAQLVAEDLEVATPLRDEGVDLLVYTGKRSEGNFVAAPIQLKSAQAAIFGVDTKFLAFPSLILACVWGVKGAKGMQLYLMTYKQALEVAEELGWTRTNDFLAGGRYTTTDPSKRVLDALAKHQYYPGLMRKLLSDIVG